MTAPTILILAGKRDGRLDPLAEAAGVSHKCRVPIAGKPLLQWVLEGVAPAYPDSPIYVSIHDSEAIADLPAVVALRAEGRLHVSIAQAGIVESVEAVVAESGGRFPLLITTGDNVLIDADLTRRLHGFAMDSGAGAVLAIARKEAIQATHPEAQRRFYVFGDQAIANCNSYWLRDARAMRAAEAFRQGGQFIKTKGRIAQAFGIVNLIRFRLGRWPLATAMRAISRRFGVKVTTYDVGDGAYAVDVDNERTFRIAEMLLNRRKPQG